MLKAMVKIDIVDIGLPKMTAKGGWKNEQSTTTIDGEKAHFACSRDTKTFLTDKEVFVNFKNNQL